MGALDVLTGGRKLAGHRTRPVVGINAVGGALEPGGYGDLVQAWRGLPFVPAAGREHHDTERELVLKAQIGSELPVEQELERWFPLWGIPI